MLRGISHQEQCMRTFARRALPILALVLAFTLTGCYQAANDTVAPTLVDLTAIAPVQAATPTPFVTPLPTSGFVAPTDVPTQPESPSATPADTVPTSEPMTVPTQPTDQATQGGQPAQP